METITDEELQRINYPKPTDDLYHMDESLIYKKPRKDRLISESRSSSAFEILFPGAFSTGAGIGSNCMVVHGNHTASGKPILTCDPHLGKTMNSFWYPTRIAWDAEDE